MSTSDFCIRCDKELSVYCGPCHDALRNRIDELRAWAKSRIAHCAAIEEKYNKTTRYDIPIEPVEARQEKRTLEAVLKMLEDRNG